MPSDPRFEVVAQANHQKSCLGHVHERVRNPCRRTLARSPNLYTSQEKPADAVKAVRRVAQAARATASAQTRQHLRHELKHDHGGVQQAYNISPPCGERVARSPRTLVKQRGEHGDDAKRQRDEERRGGVREDGKLHLRRHDALWGSRACSASEQETHRAAAAKVARSSYRRRRRCCATMPPQPSTTLLLLLLLLLFLVVLSRRRARREEWRHAVQRLARSQREWADDVWMMMMRLADT